MGKHEEIRYSSKHKKKLNIKRIILIILIICLVIVISKYKLISKFYLILKPIEIENIEIRSRKKSN